MDLKCCKIKQKRLYHRGAKKIDRFQNPDSYRIFVKHLLKKIFILRGQKKIKKMNNIKNLIIDSGISFARL